MEEAAGRQPHLVALAPRRHDRARGVLAEGLRHHDADDLRASHATVDTVVNRQPVYRVASHTAPTVAFIHKLPD
ncbi:hypothetical protein Sviol_49450 [Streptomyces violascens]|uniref:Uncharacterized protein n=1 Tax=Streptomyces violascens TaxID=67381 RepID=A0ABQ3QTC8_9ACTN|nr:hypothetical protein Sviol_49450 [Streptomyces violascens]